MHFIVEVAAVFAVRDPVIGIEPHEQAARNFMRCNALQFSRVLCWVSAHWRSYACIPLYSKSQLMHAATAKDTPASGPRKVCVSGGGSAGNENEHCTLRFVSPILGGGMRRILCERTTPRHVHRPCRTENGIR